MIHARKDYDNIQDPLTYDSRPVELIRETEGRSPIGCDEPVMLFRAQDKLMPKVLKYYASLLAEENIEMAQVVNDHVSLALAWQALRGCKNPDLPGQNEAKETT